MKPSTLILALATLSATAAAAQPAGDRYGFSRGGYAPTYSYGAPSAPQQGQPAYSRVLTWANKGSIQGPGYGAQIAAPYPQPQYPAPAYSAPAYAPAAYSAPAYPSQARTYAPQAESFAPQAPRYFPQAPSYGPQAPFYPSQVQAYAPPAPSYAPQYERSFTPAPAPAYDQMSSYGSYGQGQMRQAQPAPQWQDNRPTYAPPSPPPPMEEPEADYRQPTIYIPTAQARSAPQYPQPSEAYEQDAPGYHPPSPAPQSMQAFASEPQDMTPEPIPSSTPTAYMPSSPAPTSYIPLVRPPMSAPEAVEPENPRPDAMSDLRGGPPPQRRAEAEQYSAPSTESSVTRVPVGAAQSQPPPPAVQVAAADPPGKGKVHYYSLHRAFGLRPDTITPPDRDSNMVLVGPGESDSGSAETAEPSETSAQDDDNASEKPF